MGVLVDFFPFSQIMPRRGKFGRERFTTSLDFLLFSLPSSIHVVKGNGGLRGGGSWKPWDS